MLVIPTGDINPSERKPYVNYFLLGLNIIVFAAVFLLTDYEKVIINYGFIPSKGFSYTMITSIFLHGGLLHLLGNMLYLWIVGDNVEDKFGHFWYLLLYLASGAIAVFFHWALVQGRMAQIPCIGASGAIAGILGAYVVLFPRSKIVFWYLIWLYIIFFRIGTFNIASFWAIGFWFVMQLFSQAATGAGTGIAYGAHIGGFIFGAVVTGILLLLGVLRAKWREEQEEEF